MLRLVAVAVLLLVLAAGPAFAQNTGAAQAKPPVPAVASATLPVDTRIAFVNLQLVFNESALGQEGQERRRVLNEKLFAGLSARQKEIQALREKITSQQGVVEAAILRGWTNELQRLEREAQFAQQEAQVQSNQLWEEILAGFEAKLVPIVDAIRVEKGLHAVFAIQDEASGISLLSMDPGLDLSAEVIKRLDGK